jgi:hypothetical protein
MDNDKENTELEKWRSCGRRLWPYIRYFGLFGADLPAIEAAADMARLLGEDTQAAVSQRAAEDAAAQTIEHIATWIVDSNWIKRMAPDKREEFLKSLRGLGG